jgi:hypothetical protein
MQVGSQRGSIPVATADFDAILLTDSWKNMDMLVSSLHYCGAQNKLMMGTALWEQNLTSGSRNNAAAFALTIYPAVWNPAAGERSAVFSKVVAARGSKADDWTVLGFDFVQMAAALSVHPGWTPDSLNKSLASIKVDWAGAPFSWDISGKASRQLFVLTPAAVGSIPVNTSALRERLQQESSAPASSEVNSPASLDQLVDSITKN